MTAVLLALGLGLAACNADSVRRPPAEPDAGSGELLAPPELGALPALTPLDSLAVRGTTDGNRVVGVGALGAVITPVLPGGTFCQEQPVPDEGEAHILFYAVGGDGRVSRPIAVDVARDPAAPAPAEPPCSGAEVGTCEETEVCGADDEDEDCDGWADACDATCSNCDDDAYEPNDVPVNVPTLLPGTYDLEICPCRDDWFAFQVAPGGRVRATARFSHASLDIDLRLYQVDGDGGVDTPVASSASTSDQESIAFESTTGGVYYLRVFPYHTALKPRGGYALEID